MGVATAEDAGLGAAMRGHGYSLSTAPLFSNIGLAWQSLRALGADGTEYREQIESGELRATVAAAEQSGSWDPALVRTKAQPDGDGWRLSGTKLFVPDAAGADMILTVARSIAGPSLFAVDADAAGLAITELDSIDSNRPLFRVGLKDTPAVLLGKEGRGGALMVKTMDLAMTALAGEQVGLIERAVAVLLHRDLGEAGLDLAQTALDHATAVSLWKQAQSAEAEAGSAAMAHTVAGGYTVWPREVEDVLYTHEAVLEAGVVGVPDPYRGETVKAYVSLRQGHSVDPEDLVAYCRERLAAYKYPRRIEIVDAIPKTATGKILRRELRGG